MNSLTTNKPEAEPIDADTDELTIAQMYGRYSSMPPAANNMTRVHVILKDGKVWSYQYAFLDALSTFEGASSRWCSRG